MENREGMPSLVKLKGGCALIFVPQQQLKRTLGSNANLWAPKSAKRGIDKGVDRGWERQRRKRERQRIRLIQFFNWWKRRLELYFWGVIIDDILFISQTWCPPIYNTPSRVNVHFTCHAHSYYNRFFCFIFHFFSKQNRPRWCFVSLSGIGGSGFVSDSSFTCQNSSMSTVIFDYYSPKSWASGWVFHLSVHLSCVNAKKLFTVVEPLFGS